MKLATAEMTSSGGHTRNEDALLVRHGDGFAMLALADGLGGHGGGALAARCCVDTVATAFARAPDLADATLQALVDDAARAVAELRQRLRQAAGTMRTTLALLAACRGLARWAHVGDSRIYWYRDGELMRRTRDHSVAELVSGLADKSGVAEPDGADRHRLLRAIGAGETCRADLATAAIALQPGDAFLLCSDGLWNHISDAEIAAGLRHAASPEVWRQALADVMAARLANAPSLEADNYSMIAAMIMP